MLLSESCRTTLWLRLSPARGSTTVKSWPTRLQSRSAPTPSERSFWSICHRKCPTPSHRWTSLPIDRQRSDDTITSPCTDPGDDWKLTCAWIQPFHTLGLFSLFVVCIYCYCTISQFTIVNTCFVYVQLVLMINVFNGSNILHG